MWCQFHEQIYQEFPVGIPRRFFLCEELLYMYMHSTTTKFFLKKGYVPHQGKARKSPLFLKCPQKKKRNSLKNEKNLFSSFFFTFQKKCFSHHLPLGPRSALVFKKEVMHE